MIVSVGVYSHVYQCIGLFIMPVVYNISVMFKCIIPMVYINYYTIMWCTIVSQKPHLDLSWYTPILNIIIAISVDYIKQAESQLVSHRHR